MGFTPVGRVCLIGLTTIDNSLIAGLSNLHMEFIPVGRVYLIELTTIDNCLIANDNCLIELTTIDNCLTTIKPSGMPTNVTLVGIL